MRCLLLVTGFFMATLTLSAQLSLFNDTIYHFTFEYPDTWAPTDEKGESLRTVLVSPDKKLTLVAYGFVLENGYYDLEKLALLDTAWFPWLGKVKETYYHKASFMDKFLSRFHAEILKVGGVVEFLYVEKLYEKNAKGYYARSYITEDEQYAYVLIAYSKTDNFSEIDPIFDSFEATASWFTKRKRDLFSIFFSSRALLTEVRIWIVIATLVLLVLLGGYFKKWNSRRKALKKFRASLIDGGKEPDKKTNYAYKTTSRKTMYALILALVVIIVATIYLGKVIVLMIFPIFFLLGYWGVKAKEALDELM